MSRLDELKKQYPELNVTVFDMMTRLDSSKTYKYLPLMCKIFSKTFNPKEKYHSDDLPSLMLEVQANLMNKGISTNELTNNQMFYILNYIAEHFPNDVFQTLNEFMRCMNKGLIENTDVTSYKDIESVRGALTLASMKELSKELEGQIIKEFEDEKWLILRPLTFAASAKYGASTRWCTTYQREKNYFEKYWRRGILVYFINKQTGYKFAGYKGLQGDSEFSFWNAEDSRVDYLDVETDDYLFPIVRNIFKSQSTNKNLCSDKIQNQVHEECIDQYGKIMALEPVDLDQPAEPTIREHINTDLENTLRARLINAVREIENETQEMEERVVRMSAPTEQVMSEEYLGEHIPSQSA